MKTFKTATKRLELFALGNKQARTARLTTLVWHSAEISLLTATLNLNNQFSNQLQSLKSPRILWKSMKVPFPCKRQLFKTTCFSRNQTESRYHSMQDTQSHHLSPSWDNQLFMPTQRRTLTDRVNSRRNRVLNVHSTTNNRPRALMDVSTFASTLWKASK